MKYSISAKVKKLQNSTSSYEFSSINFTAMRIIYVSIFRRMGETFCS
jgi:hypothetical protein